jgi:hypothetical protein
MQKTKVGNKGRESTFAFENYMDESWEGKKSRRND